MRQQARTQGKKLSKKQASKHYNQLFVGWFTALPPEKQALWAFFWNNRGSEIHVERTKTVTKEMAMSTPLIPGFPYRSERSRAFGAHYVVQQQVAAWYPEMADRIKELGPLSGTGIWTYIQEHHLDNGERFNRL